LNPPQNTQRSSTDQRTEAKERFNPEIGMCSVCKAENEGDKMQPFIPKDKCTMNTTQVEVTETMLQNKQHNATEQITQNYKANNTMLITLRAQTTKMKTNLV